ncbi:MAG: hypothetical protein ACREOK_08845 [Gemmatimonadaceae bacterium]
MPDSGSGDPRERSADHAALPPALADASLADRTLILPFDAALAAIDHLTNDGRRIENWEGWVKLRDGGRAKSLTHGGSFALPPDPSRAAATAKEGIRRAHERWQRNPEYAGAELYFGLTFARR